MVELQSFLKKYRLTAPEFEATGLSWEDLCAIEREYLSQLEDLNAVSELIARLLRREPRTHSVRLRVKDPEHLIEKIIRKKRSNPDRVIDITNYTQEVTDLVGVRVLHLFSDDWIPIDRHIRKIFDLREPPVAYCRGGDEAERFFAQCDCDLRPHDAGYRSVHYVISQMIGVRVFTAEVQVRTLFQEGWGEIDHQVRYPYMTDVEIINEYLKVFNRLAGNADEMASYIKQLRDHHLESEALVARLNEEKDAQRQEYERQLQAFRRIADGANADRETAMALRRQVKELEMLVASDLQARDAGILTFAGARGVSLLTGVPPEASGTQALTFDIRRGVAGLVAQATSPGVTAPASASGLIAPRSASGASDGAVVWEGTVGGRTADPPAEATNSSTGRPKK